MMHCVLIACVSCLLIGCSGSGGAERNAGGSPGTAGGNGGVAAGGHGGGIAGGSGAGGSAGAAGAAQGGAPAELFTDPAVPECEESAFPIAKVRGTLGEDTIDYEFTGSSLIQRGLYRVDRVVDGVVQTDYELTWDGTLTMGAANAITGGKFLLPDDQPGGGLFYCATSGEFGPLPESEQPLAEDRAAFKFRIDGVRMNEDCSGPEVPADLRACIFRTHGSIP